MSPSVKQIDSAKTEGNQDLTCPMCQRVLRSEIILQKHMKMHITGLSFPCQICGHCFHSMHYLSRHVKCKHPSHQMTNEDSCKEDLSPVKKCKPLRNLTASTNVAKQSQQVSNGSPFPADFLSDNSTDSCMVSFKEDDKATLLDGFDANVSQMDSDTISDYLFLNCDDVVRAHDDVIKTLSSSPDNEPDTVNELNFESF